MGRSIQERITRNMQHWIASFGIPEETERVGGINPVDLGAGFYVQLMDSSGDGIATGIMHQHVRLDTGEICGHPGYEHIRQAGQDDRPASAWLMTSWESFTIEGVIRCPRCQRIGKIKDNKWFPVSTYQ